MCGSYRGLATLQPLGEGVHGQADFAPAPQESYVFKFNSLLLPHNIMLFKRLKLLLNYRIPFDSLNLLPLPTSLVSMAGGKRGPSKKKQITAETTNFKGKLQQPFEKHRPEKNQANGPAEGTDRKRKSYVAPSRAAKAAQLISLVVNRAMKSYTCLRRRKEQGSLLPLTNQPLAPQPSPAIRSKTQGKSCQVPKT